MVEVYGWNSKNRGTPKWMVYNGKPDCLMDDLGGKPPICGKNPYYWPNTIHVMEPARWWLMVISHQGEISAKVMGYITWAQWPLNHKAFQNTLKTGSSFQVCVKFVPKFTNKKPAKKQIVLHIWKIQVYRHSYFWLILRVKVGFNKNISIYRALPKHWFTVESVTFKNGYWKRVPFT